MSRRFEEPPTIFLNGKFLTLSKRLTKASAVLVEGGRISAVGSAPAVRRAAPRGTEKVDLKGLHVVPGFNDCHTHFVQMGIDSMAVDLSGTRSLDEALRRIRMGVPRTPEGRWVIATGWSESAWPGGRFITGKDLDLCSPGRPVVAYRVCGHLCTVNSKALSELDLDHRNADVEKGSGGRPTGVLTEDAVSVCRKATEPDAEVRIRGLRLATKKAHRLGVTSVTENGSPEDLATCLKAARDGTLGVRVCFNMPSGNLDSLLSTSMSTGFGDSWLRLGGLKIFCDGALGARSAALSEPYADDPRNKGMFVHERKDLDEMTSKANEAGIQLAIHAIGDVGIDVAIDSISSALKSAPRKDHRHRIEHLELPSVGNLRRMSRLGLIASMQPNFVGEWGGTEGMYVSRLGRARTGRNNPFREVLDAGVRLVFGSDCMPFSPLYGLSSAVNAPFPAQRISGLEGISAYTRDAAFATFEEDDKGTIDEGKLADFVVLSGDPTAREAVRSTSVMMTVLGGRIVFRAPGMDRRDL